MDNYGVHFMHFLFFLFDIFFQCRVGYGIAIQKGMYIILLDTGLLLLDVLMMRGDLNIS